MNETSYFILAQHSGSSPTGSAAKNRGMGFKKNVLEE